MQNIVPLQVHAASRALVAAATARAFQGGRRALWSPVLSRVPEQRDSQSSFLGAGSWACRSAPQSIQEGETVLAGGALANTTWSQKPACRGTGFVH